jgi:hypothetical protein
MSDLFPEEPIDAPALVPETDVPEEPEDVLAELENALQTFPSDVDLVVGEEEPPPIGRSWAFDWAMRDFVRSSGSAGPQPTRGLETLTEWIEKCLRTARGAHPVHPQGYGVAQASADGLVGGPVGSIPPDLEERVKDALLFHPRITDVRGFSYSSDPDDEWLGVSFTFEVDGGAEERQVENLGVAL